jgi:hypothetical protein
MKKLINIMTGLAALVIAAASCTKDNNMPVQSMDMYLVGEWHMVGAKIGEDLTLQDTDVYLAIQANGTFELYQQTYSQNERYDKYSGNCWTENGTISGIYSDGEPWGAKYEYSKTVDGFILRSFNFLEMQRYTKTAIPEEVKANANPVHTKSSQAAGSPIL